MTNIDQIYAGLVYLWTQLDKTIVGAAITAFVVACLRMKKHGNFQWVEALLCGIFAALSLFGLSFLGSITGITVPNELTLGAAQIISGAIGWYGTERYVRFLETKAGYIDKEVDNDSN